MSKTPMSNGLSTQRLLAAALRTDLTAFIARVFRELVPGTPYLSNWHIEAMAYQLTEVAAGRLRRLVITLPPRHLKSLSVTIAFVAWLLGQDPTRRIIAVSYSDDLASAHARHCRQVIASPWYQALFPETRLSSSKNTESEFETTAGGSRYSTSVGGTLTGRGGNLIILDDPQKPADALSESRRASLRAWYDQTLYSRLDNKMTDPLIVVMQRLHPDDLVSHILQQEAWYHLCLPAIAEQATSIPIGPHHRYHRPQGEVLHAARESRVMLTQIRQAMGHAAFAAQYQQQPMPPDGAILSWRWFQTYEVPWVPQPGDVIIHSWDTAAIPGLERDYSVGLTFVIRGGQYYLISVFREHVDYPALRRAVLARINHWPTFEVIIENANTGTALVQELRELAFHQRIPLQLGRIRNYVATDSKVARMAAESAAIEAGRVWLPRQAPWLEAFRQEVLLFPHGRYDDQIDALSQFLWRMRIERFQPPSPTEDPPDSVDRRGRPFSAGIPL